MSESLQRAMRSQSEDFRRMNPALFGHTPSPTPVINEPAKPAKRIRQSEKSLTKLEMEYERILRVQGIAARAQSVTLKLANGLRYTPDFIDLASHRAWEVKGRHAWDDALVKLKVAASTYPEIKFFLVWKQDGRWCEQEVLP